MTNTPLLQRWYDEVWNNANESFIDEMLHPQAIIHGLQTDQEKVGHEAFKPFYKSFRENFPTVKVKLTPIFGNGEFEAVKCVVNAKNVSGQETEFNGISIAKFTDGKLAEGWNGFDFLTMYQQLGFNLTK